MVAYYREQGIRGSINIPVLDNIIHFNSLCVDWYCGVREKRLGDLIRVIGQNNP